ncbi:MAG: hypothetical protein FWD03_03980 [Defluviitaleaceae bacterium]|nr:hypothetical protein [Defluviitaleaceae bacterium]
MDMKNDAKADQKSKTFDVDALLQKALNSSEKPDVELVKKVKHEWNKEEAFLKKLSFRRTFGRVAAIAAASLIVSTTVFAAGMYLGSFDRLRGVIGGEQADLLQPLEISNLPEPEVVVVVNDVDDASDAEAAASDAEIRVELVAISVIDNVVDVYVTLEDLVGNRLDGDFAAGHIVHPVGEAGVRIGGVSAPCEIISREDGVVTLRSRQFFTHSIAGMELMYALDGINYNQRRYIGYDLGIDLTALTTQPSMPFINDFLPPTWMWGTDYTFRYTGEYGRYGDPMVETFLTGTIGEQVSRTGGLSVLQPHLHDVALDFGNIETLISSIGIVDDRLHVQLHRLSDSVMLEDAEGNWISPNLGFEFNLDNDGNSIPVEEQRGPGCGLYTELIFEIDLERLYEYRLIGFFMTADRISFNWSTTFEIERNEAQLIADGLAVPHGSDVITEVRISPSLIHVKVEGDFALGEGARAASPAVILHMEDGTVQTVQSGGINGRDEAGTIFVNLFYDVVGNPINLDEIISIEVAGEMAALR